MGIKILTDTACELPKEIIEENNIGTIPISIHYEEDNLLDGIDITSEELLNNMKSGMKYTTSQISPLIFEEYFKKYLDEYDTIIYIGFSSGISGTYQSSLIAKNNLKDEYKDKDIIVIDTKCVSLGLGIVVLNAAKYVKEGAKKDFIIEQIQDQSSRMEHIFTVDDLEYLYRGGRVSFTSKFIGGMLSIKPILNVNKEGKLIPFEKVRGRKKSIKKMVEVLKEREKDIKNQLIGINHGNDIESAEYLRDLIKEDFGVDSFIINTVGAAIGAHSGPGTLSVFFLGGGKL